MYLDAAMRALLVLFEVDLVYLVSRRFLDLVTMECKRRKQIQRGTLVILGACKLQTQVQRPDCFQILHRHSYDDTLVVRGPISYQKVHERNQKN